MMQAAQSGRLPAVEQYAGPRAAKQSSLPQGLWQGDDGAQHRRYCKSQAEGEDSVFLLGI